MNVERLPGGWMNEARLVNGGVHRPLGPHSAFVHQLLRFLSDVGFGGAPSILRVEGDEEVLTYIEGHVPVEHPRHVEPVVFSDAGVESSLRLIRLLHDMTAGSALAGDAEVVCHGDLVPWNTVYDAQGAIALIDWDNASPLPVPMTSASPSGATYASVYPTPRPSPTNADSSASSPTRTAIGLRRNCSTWLPMASAATGNTSRNGKRTATFGTCV